MKEPRFWKRLKRWHGFPIPFIAPRDPAGKPMFGSKSTPRLRDCAHRQLCNVCGQKLDGVMVFMGGDVATDLRAFHEPPLHEECARASLQICPYLRDQRTESEPVYFTYARALRHSDRAGHITFYAGSVLRTERIA